MARLFLEIRFYDKRSCARAVFVNIFPWSLPVCRAVFEYILWRKSAGPCLEISFMIIASTEELYLEIPFYDKCSCARAVFVNIFPW